MTNSNDSITENRSAPTPGMDRTTARIVSELTSQILPPLTDALSSMNIGPAVREEVSRLASLLREMLDAETEQRRALLHPVETAVDEIASLSVVCTDAARAMSLEKVQNSIDAMKDMTAAFNALNETLKTLTDAVAAVPQSVAEHIDASDEKIKGAIETMEKFRESAAGEFEKVTASNGELREPIASISEEIASVKALVESAGEAVRGIKLPDSSASFTSVEEGISALEKSIGTREKSAEAGRTAIMDAIFSLRAAVRSDVTSAMESLERSVRSQAQEGMRSAAAPRDDSSLSRSLELALPSWEGLLRAHSQAQTRELDELSNELTHMHRQAEETIIQRLRDFVRDESFSVSNSFNSLLGDRFGRCEQQVRTLTRMTAAALGLGGFLFLLLLAVLVRM